MLQKSYYILILITTTQQMGSGNSK